MGNNAGAMRELEVWLKHVEANSGAESREMFSGLMQSARMCAASKDVGRGVVLVEKAIGLIDKVAPTGDAGRVYMRSEAADVMAQLGNYECGAHTGGAGAEVGGGDHAEERRARRAGGEIPADEGSAIGSTTGARRGACCGWLRSSKRRFRA